MWVGIDPGWNSPAFAICDPEARTIDAYAWAQLKREETKAFKTFVCMLSGFSQSFLNGRWVFSLTLFPRFEKVKDDDPLVARMTRIHHFVEKVMEILEEHDDGGGESKIGIENYAFNAEGSSASKLYELGGVLRYELWGLGGNTLHEIVPARAKCRFSGNGHATKLQMYEAFRAYGFPDLLQYLGMTINKDGKVPKPLEDIVDAVALMCTEAGHVKPKPKKPTKKRKRKGAIAKAPPKKRRRK